MKNVSEFGNILGEVIQIVDDIDDIIDKRGGIDNATGKWGMPVAFLFESKSDAEKEELYPLLESFENNPPKRYKSFAGWEDRCDKLNVNQLAVVAWVQNPETKEILQSQYFEL